MQTEENKAELHPKNGEITFMMPSTNALGALKKAEKGRQLTVSYKKKEEWLAEVDKPVKCFFLGLKEATDAKGETYFIAKLHDGEKAFVCAQTVLVQSLMSTELGQGVEITCTGSTKTNGNEIPLFDVVELNVNITKGDE
ncbi:hypothetical protein [Psychroflexus aestuariivivens]|uniref:hypothetical protein n=1 Tax=Psychroflexus aestuariivivens TaxID=1795040 RepID=UPI000FD78567|nr:hypothetical protein [Psychroflexus aestuariivivens]